MADNPHFLEKDIHDLKLLTESNKVVQKVFEICDKITGLNNDYDLTDSQIRHTTEKIVKELYRNLSNHGITGILGLPVQIDEIDAGFLPKTLDSFTGSNTNPLTKLTGIDHGYSMRKINPDYTGYALRGAMAATTAEFYVTGTSKVEFDVKFDENGEITRNSICDITSYGDGTFSISNFSPQLSSTRTTLGGVMDANQDAIDSEAISGPANGKVLTWYDQFGDVNLTAVGRTSQGYTEDVGGHGANGPTFFTGAELFDYIKIINTGTQPSTNGSINNQALRFSTQNIPIKSMCYTMALHSQGPPDTTQLSGSIAELRSGTIDLQMLFGNHTDGDSAYDGTAPYILMFPESTGDGNLRINGATSSPSDSGVMSFNGEGFITGYEKRQFFLPAEMQEYHDYAICFDDDFPANNEWDGVGYIQYQATRGGTNIKEYYPHMHLKEWLVANNESLKTQHAKSSKAAKARHGHI